MYILSNLKHVLHQTTYYLNLKPELLITKSSSTKLYSSKISNIVDHFWEK